MSWEHAIGLGVAGNFTGHLEQAGEASDFEGLEIRDAHAPKGVFPFYVPLAAGTRSEHFLHRYPVSSERIRLGSHDERHQIEPEVALLCDLEYEAERVVRVTPRAAMAHNDCSIRREGAKKISEKKNWGPESKGTAREAISIDRFEPGGVLDEYRIACFLLREGTLHDYGVDSPVSGYSYIYAQLLDWLVEKLNQQVDAGPLENIAEWLAIADRPAQALISIGATRYTEYGETHFLEPGDTAIVALYDARRFEPAAIRRLARGDEPAPAGLSLLRQQVV
ncbi:MAG: hypothetical protein JRG86_02610 [Deltaproteobacteria bacterium]|nr:hypothetical protein [Deltaproteobacteria bacterium]MBW2499184.1 hypothetical protein [Deltaproteobacteria bacterium]